MQDYSGYGGYGQPPSGDYGHTAPLPPMPPPPPPRRRVGLLSYLAVALVAGALGAGTVVALYHPAASTPAIGPPSLQQHRARPAAQHRGARPELRRDRDHRREPEQGASRAS